MAWEWQVWRCFDDIRETFEEKGWEYGFDGRNDNEAVPLLAEFDGYRIVFFKRDPGTGECWFELCDGVRGTTMFVRGAQNIPTPEQAAVLLEDHGVPAYETAYPGTRPVYRLPVAPAL